jgi:hypothetical protein
MSSTVMLHKAVFLKNVMLEEVFVLLTLVHIDLACI